MLKNITKFALSSCYVKREPCSFRKWYLVPKWRHTKVSCFVTKYWWHSLIWDVQFQNPNLWGKLYIMKNEYKNMSLKILTTLIKIGTAACIFVIVGWPSSRSSFVALMIRKSWRHSWTLRIRLSRRKGFLWKGASSLQRAVRVPLQQQV